MNSYKNPQSNNNNDNDNKKDRTYEFSLLIGNITFTSIAPIMLNYTDREYV